MSTDEYKEVADELDSLLRVYTIDDERISRPLKEAVQSARTRYNDRKAEGK